MVFFLNTIFILLNFFHMPYTCKSARQEIAKLEPIGYIRDGYIQERSSLIMHNPNTKQSQEVMLTNCYYS